MSFSAVEVYDLSGIYSLAIVKVIEINNILDLRYFCQFEGNVNLSVSFCNKHNKAGLVGCRILL